MRHQYEIERRFLITGLKPGLPLGASILITQGYFEVPFPEHSLRIRIIDDKTAFIAQKLGSGIRRIEREHCIAIDTAKMLLESCAHIIRKKRYSFKGWTIDFFCEPFEGVIIAEKEMPSLRNKRFVPPSWLLGAREVTDSLSTLHLARLATELRGKNNATLSEIYQLLSRRIAKIVITGGPCSGKSTLLEFLKDQMREVIQCVPEAATMFISQTGIRPLTQEPVELQRFSRAIYRMQKILEATSAEHASSLGKKCLVIDRGSMDSAAYMAGGIEEFEYIFQTTCAAEYAQYDLIVCLEMPPKDIYEQMKGNNAARYESSYAQADERGEKIKQIWKNHPGFCFIANGSGWEEKKENSLGAIRLFIQGL